MEAIDAIEARRWIRPKNLVPVSSNETVKAVINLFNGK